MRRLAACTTAAAPFRGASGLLVRQHWATMAAFGYDPKNTLGEIDALSADAPSAWATG